MQFLAQKTIIFNEHLVLEETEGTLNDDVLED
jgi:hypothetical protein